MPSARAFLRWRSGRRRRDRRGRRRCLGSGYRSSSCASASATFSSGSWRSWPAAVQRISPTTRSSSTRPCRTRALFLSREKRRGQREGGEKKGGRRSSSCVCHPRSSATRALSLSLSLCVCAPLGHARRENWVPEEGLLDKLDETLVDQHVLFDASVGLGLWDEALMLIKLLKHNDRTVSHEINRLWFQVSFFLFCVCPLAAVLSLPRTLGAAPLRARCRVEKKEEEKLLAVARSPRSRVSRSLRCARPSDHQAVRTSGGGVGLCARGRHRAVRSPVPQWREQLPPR